ncbi:hypothetical protein P4H35_31455 [Paenibacillus taichungensis]|uniref:hypothetical protein n=1 Tax=Paenibacillus taichungensis TaxID=484184 RepID=UPI002DB81D1E|nr:hypothetical protein [Paenibacillus taichungensis]MEC0200870.1 hypothetical protein [Paenibacillus taichungensis]
MKISFVLGWRSQGREVKKLVVEGQEHIPIEVAILAAFLFYRYKFLSQAKDKNLYRLPEWTRT